MHESWIHLAPETEQFSSNFLGNSRLHLLWVIAPCELRSSCARRKFNLGEGSFRRLDKWSEVTHFSRSITSQRYSDMKGSPGLLLNRCNDYFFFFIVDSQICDYNCEFIALTQRVITPLLFPKTAVILPGLASPLTLQQIY